MPRITIKRKEEKEEIDNEDDALSWSKRRIIIAAVVVALLFGGIVYGVTLDKGKSVLGANQQNTENMPQIEIPSQEKIVEIIEQAKENLSKVDVENVVSSQPQIKKVISDLEQLTKTDKNAKNVVCDMVCK